MRVSVKLKDASGTDFERASFEQPLGNPLALRDTLANRVSEFLRKRLGGEVRLREQRQGTQSADAWALLQRAEQHHRAEEAAIASSDTAAVLRELASADTLLAQAAALDANWPDVPVLRGTLDYRASRFFGDDQYKAASWIDKGLTNAEHAVSLAPNNPDALELRGTLRYWRYLLGLEPDATALSSCWAQRRGPRGGSEDQPCSGRGMGRAEPPTDSRG